MSPWIFIFGPLAFVVILVFGHNALDLTGRGRIYFFDKLCVCQYDEEKKKDSVYSFAAIVKHSREFTMLWDEHYFTLVSGELVVKHPSTSTSLEVSMRRRDPSLMLMATSPRHCCKP
eukprot:TRINITY_DN30409_c0_g1_i2.p2 TRINITY_DN30409_c0_g1~~TRINITY_DN30409_c0_g1_i2.p2  ORF type:complete len:117 (-),score=9.16 TRINITY_DN30409_c0_g1_i2:42-392(-)